MYEANPNFSPPADSAILWRYMDFTKFVSLLDLGALFFCPAAQLGDPFEGRLSQANYDTFSSRYPAEVADSIRNHAPEMDRIRGKQLVNCWHRSDYESDGMWKIYAAHNAGVAIETDFASLAASFKGDEPVYIGQVNYVDYNSVIIPERNLFSALLYKRTHFEHEREVRAVIATEDLSDRPSGGRYIPVDLSVLIHQVVISPLEPSWFSHLVASLVSRLGVRLQITQSSMALPPPQG